MKTTKYLVRRVGFVIMVIFLLDRRVWTKTPLEVICYTILGLAIWGASILLAKLGSE